MANTTTKTRANAGTEEQLDVEVSSILWHVGEPADCPLLTLIGGDLYTSGQSKPEKVEGRIKKEMSSQVDYKVIEKDPLARTVTMNGAVADTTTGTFTVASSANLTGGETIRNGKTGEIAYVHTVTSATAIVVNRNLGSTAFQVGAADVWKVVGHAVTEGSDKRNMKSQLATPRTRYNQIFKRSFGVTGTGMAVKLVTDVSLWDEEQIQAMANHKKDIEFSFWLNPAADSTTDASSNTVYISRGILAEMGTDQTYNAQGALTEDVFFGPFAEMAFEFGPKRKAFFPDARLRSKINSWPRMKLQTESMKTVYGYNVKEIDTGHGIFEMHPCGVFDEFLDDSAKGVGAVLDLDRVRMKYLEGRDSKLEQDIQTRGKDAREGQYVSEVGISLYSIKHHAYLMGTGA
jgi:hypothetical protein